ncbi:nuclear transport factor 2 family protein [Marinicaulis aureus]|uniref:Nuclear transport factor 2 family protein n=1 Tax=Hyphococcus aureus TaxID=2666033 RepID=A0ABW1KVX2_9PROT
MKRVASASALAIMAVAASAIEGAAAKTTCTRGSDARVIEVITPGTVGQSCDVRYTRGGGANVSVPYHADNSDSFCSQKADAMVKRLALSGFACVQSAPALRADASTAGSDYVVEARRPEPEAASQPLPAPSPAPAAVAETIADEPAPAAAPPGEPQQLAQASEPAALSPVETSAPSAALEDEMSKILAQPPIEAAANGPAQLVAQHAEPPTRPQASPVGRLVGAEPDAPRQATAITQASAQEAAPAPQPETAAVPAPEPVKPAEVQTPAPQPEKAAAPEPAPSTQLRTPADVIRATLMAQAAAWNEGDLDGFMNSYWKSDELKFVSGVNVTRGWNATMKRYRDRYSGGEGLGQLGFEKLEVKLVTNDVAVVTGRFNLARSAETSSGAFSLVMRRDAGAWKIVHDHTASDPAQ